VLVPSFTGILA